MWRWHYAHQSAEDLGLVISHSDGREIDVTDTQIELWKPSEQAAMESLLAEANAAEVYRKALEPFAARLGGWIEDARLNGVIHPWFEGSLGPEEVAALREACRLMGVPLPGAEAGDDGEQGERQEPQQG